MESLKWHYIEHYTSQLKETRQQFSSSPRHCDVCELDFQDEKELLFHVGFHHDTINQLREGRNQDRLKIQAEYEKHENEKERKEEKCVYCAKHFENKLNLLDCYAQHFLNELRIFCKSLLDSEQQEQCPFCYEKFEHFDSLTCHLGSIHLLVNDFLIQEGVGPLVPSNEDYETYFDSREI